MDINNSYCRLCAECKPGNKQLDLQSDSDKKGDVLMKLNRVNASANFDDYLPITVCYDCVHALNKAYDFVITIECANAALMEIFTLEKVKKEKIDSEDLEGIQEEIRLNLKEELHENDDEVDSNGGSYSDLETPPQQVNKINKLKTLDIDSIPLSQLKLTYSNYHWLCTFCETQFPTIEELKTHSMKCHNICNPYRCPDCKSRKFKLENFLIHIQRHHKNLRYSCYICFEQFNTTAEVREHKKSHITSKLFCSGCHTPFTNNAELKQHTDVYYKFKRGLTLPKPLQMDGLTCNVCQKSFKTKGGLTSHVVIHTDRKKDNMCEVCGKGFFMKYNLEAHMVMHKDDRPYKCQICNYAFKSARLLKNHVGVHNNAKPYACEQCGRCFRLRKQLESHSIIHTDIHPFACPHCNKRFRFKTILNNHVRLHTGIRPYSCESCQRDFTNWSNYNKHMKRKHNLDTSKKKHTPDGVYPIDPKTGEVVVYEETKQIIEWKKNILVKRGMGRPKKLESDEMNHRT